MSDAALLARAAAHLRGRPVVVSSVQALPIHAGVSRVNVRRYEVEVDEGSPLRLVLKPCGRTERRTLAALDGLAGVPRAFVPDISIDDVLDVALEDAGEALLPPGKAGWARAADALAGIHAHFLGRGADLPWLPRLDEAYIEGFILGRCWRGAWERAVADERFLAHFGRFRPRVEASAAHLARDLLAYEARHGAQVNSLAHTDVYYGHIFERDGVALVIDWGQARYAPFFLDLGDTFGTADGGQVYREALEARGVSVPHNVFWTGFTLARRFAGLRYVWWWTQSWQHDPQDWNAAGLERMLGMAAGEAREG